MNIFQVIANEIMGWDYADVRLGDGSIETVRITKGLRNRLHGHTEDCNFDITSLGKIIITKKGYYSNETVTHIEPLTFNFDENPFITLQAAQIIAYAKLLKDQEWTEEKLIEEIFKL